MSERELFIEQYKKYVNNKADFTILNETENTFHDDTVDEAWVMWQLSVNRQGYKLVPVEPTKEMIDAGVDESDVDWKRLKFAYQAMIGAVK